MPKPRTYFFGCCQPAHSATRSTDRVRPAWSRNLGGSRFLAVGIALFSALAGPAGSAREVHVATTGQDTAPGTLEQPLRTINAAAQRAEPGDIVTVQAGTYREWVKPARGGTSERDRIIFRAAPPAGPGGARRPASGKVVIKGSERINGWTRIGEGIWKVELSSSFFGEYNPYALTVAGGWLNYGQWHHRGDVYLDEEAFVEQRTLEDVRQRPRTWSCAVQDNTTTIWANFGTTDPNEHLAEINVRESLFMPEISGLSYVTIDGFYLLHAAANWAPPVIELQMGAVGPRLGKRWIIQNCTIVNARCVGIILGQAPGVNYDDIDAYGDHIIRNNVIRRCGQAGIAGQKGATRSLITGNLIEETNYRREFGGWETAAIKFHNSVDAVISNNCVRGVFRQEQGAFGIWMDFGNQGTRITGNLICDTEAEAIFLEMDHGPMLIDNNVLLGGGIKANSENMVFAHNLFVNCPYRDSPDTERQSQFYSPHTTRVAGHKPGVPGNNQWYNNVFIGRGLDGVKAAPGYRADFNVFLQGARPGSFGGTNSIVDPFAVGLRRDDSASGIALSFQVNDAPFRIEVPAVGPELVGTFLPIGQTLEDSTGHPITVNTDYSGRPLHRRVPGPSAALQRGENGLSWPRSAPPDQPRTRDASIEPLTAWPESATAAESSSLVSRPFHLGFTRWPADLTAEGVRLAEDFAHAHGDIVSVMFIGGIPWPEAFEDKLFSLDVRANLGYRPPAGKKLFLSISPLDKDRKDLAPYWAEKDNQPLPEFWKGRALNSPEVKRAFLNFVVRAVESMKPDYLAIGIESNVLLSKNRVKWQQLKELHRATYNTLKQQYPQLPIFFTTEVLHYKKLASEARNSEQEKEVAELMEHSDLFAMSVYPHMSYDFPRPVPAGFFDFARSFHKPIAVAESGMTSRDVELKAFGLTLRGSEADQVQFTELLLQAASRDGYKFVINFATTDFEKLCARLPAPTDDLARIWAYTGLQTSDGKPKPALAVWDAHLRTP